MDSIQPRIDIVVVQMDGDVVRKEREVHCLCASTVCNEKGKGFPLYCEKAVERMCPIDIPCQSHSYEINDMINHGKKVLDETISASDKSRIIITIPCDSTDAWIVAAYDDVEDINESWYVEENGKDVYPIEFKIVNGYELPCDVNMIKHIKKTRLKYLIGISRLYSGLIIDGLCRL